MTRRSHLCIAAVLSLVPGLSAFACSDSGTDGSGTGGTSAGGTNAGGTNTGGTNTGGTGTGGKAAGGTTAGGATAGGATAGGINAGGMSGGTTPGGAGSGAGGGGAATAGTPNGGTGAGGAAGGASGGPGGGAGGGAVGGSGGGGGTAPTPDVLTVQLSEVRQIIRGFGINATIMPAGKSLPWQQLYTLEGEKALGLSILRIGMHENGGHRDVPSDWTQARTLGAKIIGSCWSAPAAWKDNNSTTGGGHLLADRYDDWATRIADYAATNQLYAMSIGNETDFASCSPSQGRACSPPLTDEYESMVYTGKELAAFVKVAGPILKEKAPNTKLIAPEASLWIHVWSNLSPTNKANGGYDSSDPLGCKCYSNDINDAAALAKCDTKCTTGEAGYDYGHWLAKDEASWAALDILGVHEYESQVGYPWPADVTGGMKTKEIWQTEMSGVMYWPEQGPSTDINNGIAVAKWIHSALTVGEASAWLYWWYEAYYQDDNEGLALTKGGNTIAKRYYTMGNFSRYIRPDVFHAVRVAGPAPAKVLVSAYKGDSGEVVVVAINETAQAVELPIAITGGTAPASMVPYVTSSAQNWAAGTAAPVANGSFTAALPATSVTTYVGK
jgi:O-glycosyl hydrolase